jgi:hypothetical protein
MYHYFIAENHWDTEVVRQKSRLYDHEEEKGTNGYGICKHGRQSPVKKVIGKASQRNRTRCRASPLEKTSKGESK